MQSKRLSAIEAGTNMVVGIVVNLSLNTTFVFLAGLRGREALAFTGVMSVVFLVTSTIRAYIIRRVFNALETRDDR